MADPTFAAPITNPFGFPGDQAYLDVSFGDIDNDGDRDLFTNGLDGITKYYQNTGSATAPVFAAAVANPFGLPDIGQIATVALADLNNDGKLDVFLQSYVASGVINYFQNTGTASAPAFAAGVAIASTGDGFPATPTFGDIDKDGDLDLFVGHDDGNFRYFQNTGTATAPVFAPAVLNPFGLTDAGDITKPTLGDIDNDGDLDLLVGETEFGRLNYFENTGTASAPAFAPLVTNPFGLANGSYPEPNLVDIDNDGDLDVFDAQIVGELRFFRNAPNNPPVAVNDGFGTDEDTVLTGASLLANDTDPDGNPLTVTAINGSPANVGTGIALGNGILTVDAKGSMRFDPNDSYNALAQGATDTASFTYTISDGKAGGTATATATITITGVNDAPTAITPSNTTVSENDAAATIGTLTVTDPDLGDTHSFAPSDSRFEVVGGTLKLKSGISLDFETEPSVTLDVTATDQGGLSTTQAITLKVVDVAENTAPTNLSLSATRIDENVAAGTPVGTFSTVDAEGGSFTYELVTGAGDDDNAAFSIDGDVLKINASPNFEAKNSYGIRVKTTDSEGASYEASLTIAINNLNEAPAGTVTITGTATQGQTLTATNTLADPEGLGSITYTWFANGSSTGVTGDTYTLAQADVGKVFTVIAAYTDGFGTPEAVTSAPTRAIAPIPPVTPVLPPFTPNQIIALESQVLSVLGNSPTHLTASLTGQGATSVLDIAMIRVDDAAGRIDGLLPSDGGYTSAALGRATTLMSALKAGDFVGQFGQRRVPVDPGQFLQFALIQGGTLDDLKRGGAGQVFFATGAANGSGQSVVQYSPTATGLTMGFTLPGSDTPAITLQLGLDSTPASLGSQRQGLTAQSELIDLTGLTGPTTTLSFQVFREASFNNVVGLYRVEDTQGRVRDPLTGTLLSPGEVGYQQAALANRVVSNLAGQNGQTRTYSATVATGQLLSTFLVVNGSLDALLDDTPANDPTIFFNSIAANADGQDHVRLLGDNTFGFEDILGGGDQDFNDVIVKVAVT